MLNGGGRNTLLSDLVFNFFLDHLDLVDVHLGFVEVGLDGASDFHGSFVVSFHFSGVR